jgi:hypothetical protein
MAGYKRRGEEWNLQKSLAESDIQQIEQQIKAAKLRKELAQNDMKAHKKSIDQSEEIDRFLKGKFTNKDLYQWMLNKLAAVYFQTYKLAYDLAVITEKAYQYELDIYDGENEYIKSDYWDKSKNGLLAGELLMLNLNQLEKEYLEKNKRKMEIEKNISLVKLNPKALYDLKQNGSCSFDLNEIIFDLNFPGHYNRKIKTVSISIPAVVGPYESVNAMLIQNSSTITRNKDGVRLLLDTEDKSNIPESSIIKDYRSNQYIAISKGVDDYGMFSFNFNDERYLPFEETGAVSNWTLKINNQDILPHISDVILSVKYTALYGGEQFEKEVREAVGGIKLPQYLAVNLKQSNQQKWLEFINGQIEHKLNVNISKEMFPKGISAPQIKDISLRPILDSNIKVPGIKLVLSRLNDTTQVYTFDETNNYQGSCKTTDIYGEWVINTDIPNDLLKNGVIDPDKFLNMILIITFI